LGTTVGSNGVRNPKAGNPGRAEGISAGMSGGGRKRNSFNPPRGSVNYGENVRMTLGGRKGANKVNMDM
jgi:hypothetical protein